MTRVGLTLAVGALGIAGLVATASASPPPPLLVRIALTHAQPVAGERFTGLAVTPLGTARITRVYCDALLPRRTLTGRLQRFYADGVDGPAAVSCAWRIPTGAHGKKLRLPRPCVLTTQGTICSPAFSWRVK